MNENNKNVQDKKPKPPTLNDLFRNEIAEELGLMEKVKNGGWKSLSAKESGQIGGIMSRRKKELVQMILDYGEERKS